MSAVIAIVVFLGSFFALARLSKWITQLFPNPPELFGFSFMDVSLIATIVISGALAYFVGNLLAKSEPKTILDSGHVGPLLRYSFLGSLPLSILAISLMATGVFESTVGDETAKSTLAFTFVTLFYYWLVCLGIVAHRMGRRWIVWCFVGMVLFGIGAIYSYIFFLRVLLFRRNVESQ